MLGIFSLAMVIESMKFPPVEDLVNLRLARALFRHPGQSLKRHRPANMNDDSFLRSTLINTFFLICFCFDGNQSQQVVISVPMLHLVDELLYGVMRDVVLYHLSSVDF